MRVRDVQQAHSRGEERFLSCPSCGERHERGDRFCIRCRFPLMEIVGKYRMVRRLAQGGFSDIYLAHHTGLEQQAERVIKIIKPEVFERPGMLDRFRREIQVTALLSQEYEHIVRIYDDFGAIPQLGYFYVMEYLRGRSLAHLLEEAAGKLSLELVVHLFGQLCDAMQRVHERGILHRDLKPDNLFLIEREENPSFLKVLDFGIAKPLGKDLYHSGQETRTSIGTPLYMAPEQFTSLRVDERTDIYAMGAVLYEMLSGRPPFLPDEDSASSLLGVMLSHTVQPPPPLRGVAPTREIPAPVERVVLRALEKKPERRYPSVREMKADFLAAWEGSSLSPLFSSAASFGLQPSTKVPHSERQTATKAISSRLQQPGESISSKLQEPTKMKQATGLGAPRHATIQYTSELQNIWEEARNIPGFVAAGVFNQDGLILDGDTVDPGFHLDHAAATFIMLVSEANRAGEFMQIGRCGELQLTYEGVLILLRSIGAVEQGMILGLAVQQGAPLGRIRLGMDILEKNFQARLQT